MDAYIKWKNNMNLDDSLKKQLKKMKKKEIEDAFFQDLSFGTGGMRGILGPGTNRMNIYTIRKANYGLAKYLLKRYKAGVSRGVVIAHDNRNMSREFAFESARVLGCFGIKTFLFDELRPTPLLSFAVRYLHACAGIVVTASHNPPSYNGYKIYDEFGCQYTPEYADEIIKEVETVEDPFSVKVAEVEDLKRLGLLEIVGKEIDDAYTEKVLTVRINLNEEHKIKIVFTPLHGTSAVLATRLLTETGYEFYPVEAQMIHDPFFKTVKSPNPENKEAFTLAEELGHKVNADILVATDPDADRIGVAVKHDNQYVYLTGNQTGAILINYLLAEKKKLGLLPKYGKVFNTIVTSDLGAKIARNYGYEIVSTLTGFKFIGEQARLLENTKYEFIFGYEESYGYVIKDFVRDKDSLQALMLISEAANHYLVYENKTLIDVLNDIYLKYGVHREGLRNIDLFGVEGKKRIAKIMTSFREGTMSNIGDYKVIIKEDYLLKKRYAFNTNTVTELSLPISDVLKFTLANGNWFVLRPSGTEPKLKIYVAVTGKTIADADNTKEYILSEVMKIVNSIE